MLRWLKNKFIGSEPSRVDDDDLIDTGQDDTNLSDAEKYTSKIHQQILDKDVYKSSADVIPHATHISPTNQHRENNVEGEIVPIFHNIHSRKHSLVKPQQTADNDFEKSIREQAKCLYQLMYNDDCDTFIPPIEKPIQDSLRQEYNNKPVERNSTAIKTIQLDNKTYNKFEITRVKDTPVPIQSKGFRDMGFKYDDGSMSYDMFNLSSRENEIIKKIATTKKHEDSKCGNDLKVLQSNAAVNSQYNTKKTYSNIKQSRNDTLPECLKNCYGNLVKQYENNDSTKVSHLIITTSVLGKNIEVYVSNKMVYVENGVIHKCIDTRHELEVQFDCRINDGQYSANMIWIGEKPHSLAKGRQNVVYFDVPAKYYGTIENKHQIIANIDGSLIYIKIVSFIIYSTKGKRISEHLESDSLLWLDLIQNNRQNWMISSAILNPKNGFNGFADNWPAEFVLTLNCPGYLQSWPATLVPIFRDNVIEHILVKYNIGNCSHESIYKKTRYYVNNGTLQTCEKIKSYLKVQFDAHLNADNTGYVIDLIWVGAKPSKIKNNNYTKYFDIPAKYYGPHVDPQIIARVEETFVPVTVNSNTLSTCFYNSTEKKAVSTITPNSLLTMTLSKEPVKGGIALNLLFTIVHSIGEKSTAETIDWPKSYSNYIDVSNENSKDTCSSVDKRIEINKPIFRKKNILEKDNIENISCASYAKTYERVNNTMIHQTHKSSENLNTSIIPLLKSVLKYNAKHLTNLIYMAGSFAGNHEYHGFIKAQGKTIIYHMDYLFQNGISSNKDIKIGKGMACYGYSLDNQVSIGIFSVTHIATVAFTGKKPEDSEEIITSWKKHFVNGKKPADTEETITSCTKDFFPPQRDSEDFLSIFKRVCINDNEHISGGVCGIFESQKGCIGFMKAATMTIVFHTDYFFHGTPKLKILFDSGKRKTLSCFCFQLDNVVNFGEFYVTHVGVVVFTGKKPEDSEEIISSWKNRFVKSKDKGKEIQVKENLNSNQCFASSKNEPTFTATIQNDPQNYYAQILHKLQVLGSNISLHLLEIALSSHQELLYWTGNLAHCLGRVGVLNAGNKTIKFHMNNLYIDSQKCTKTMEEKSLKKGITLHSYSFPLPKTKSVGNYLVTHYAVIVFGGKKPVFVNEIISFWNKFIFESGKNIDESCSSKAEKANNTQNITVKNKNIQYTGTKHYAQNVQHTNGALRDSPSVQGSASNERAKALNDITGKVIKIMKKSILIQFTNYPSQEFEALAQCSLSNIFVYGERYGINPNMEINSHLSSSMPLHGMVENLDTPRNVGGIIVNYEMVLGWIGKKPNSKEFLDFKKRNQKQQDHANNSVSPTKNINEDGKNIEKTFNASAQKTENSKQKVVARNKSIKSIAEIKTDQNFQQTNNTLRNNLPLQRKTANKGSKNIKNILGKPDSIKLSNTSNQLEKGNHKQNQMDRNGSSASLSSTGFIPKSVKKKKLKQRQSKDRQPIKNAVTSGIISNIEPNIVQFYTKTGDYFKATADRCFLYNVCLQTVDLTHILLKDSEVEYEICEGNEVKGIWLPSSSISLDSQDVYYSICLWSDKYNVPDYTRDCLLETLDWEPTIYVPTVDSDDDTEIVSA